MTTQPEYRPNTDPSERQTHVGFGQFEMWWKMRMGLVEADLPVIPEYFAYKLQSLRCPVAEQVRSHLSN